MRTAAVLILLIMVAFTPANAGFREAAEYNARHGGVSMVVMKDGEIVFEDYPNGGAPDAAWELASGTKSFAGVIAAAAVSDGLLTLHEKVADTVVEWRDDPKKNHVTVSDLLTLTSGVDTPRPGGAPTYAEAVMLPMSAPPGVQFEYGPAAFQIFGELLRRKLTTFEGGRHRDAVEYLQARIFDPLGISPEQWDYGRDSLPRLFMGADFTARQWAVFGQFVLEGGRWNNNALADAEVMSMLTLGTAVNAAYGLSWWLNESPNRKTLLKSRAMREAIDLYTNRAARELPDDLFMAAGSGGQRLYVIPSQNTVIVRQNPKPFERMGGLARRTEGFSDTAFLRAALDAR